jgi:hypothetical protein
MPASGALAETARSCDFDLAAPLLFRVKNKGPELSLLRRILKKLFDDKMPPGA